MNANLDPAARCTAMYRALLGGWRQCRRDAHHPAERHHAGGISWTTTAPTPVLRYETCTAPGCCPWPERAVPYLGATPGPAAGKSAAGRKAAATRARKP